jgi:beta-catenin-like protein 1
MSDLFKEPTTKKRKLSHEEVKTEEINNLKRNILNFEKAINSNLMLRMKHKNEPEKFMESEIELDEEIKNFKELATQPELYIHFIKLEGLNSLLSLLTHDNSDIWLEVIEVLREMTDPSSVLENKESIILIEELIKENILQRLINLMMNLNDTKKDDAEGIHGCLEIFENLSEIKPEIASLASKTKLCEWLLKKLLNQNFDALKVTSIQ